MGVTNRLVFDPTKPAAGSSVRSYVASDDGTLITHTTIAGEEHLNVFGILGDETGAPIDATNPLDVAVVGSVSTAPPDVDAYKPTVVSVTAAETDIIVTPLANRCELFMLNNGDCPFELVTTGNAYGTGFPVYPGIMLQFSSGTSIDWKAIADTGDTTDLRLLELSCA